MKVSLLSGDTFEYFELKGYCTGLMELFARGDMELIAI